MSLYADAFSQARNPAAAFHAVQLRLSLERALTADLAELLSERAQLELAYVKSLQRLQQRLHSTHQKDSLSKEFEALEVDRKTADQQLGPAWTGLRLSLENELAETATSHQLWADKLAKQVHDPLRNSLTKGDWARWNATEAQLAAETKEYHQQVEKVQKAQAKQTKSSKASNQSKLLQAQSQLSSLGSHLAAALPAFLDQSQRLDLSHGAFLKEALVRCGTLTSDLGRERMEAGERLTVQVLGIDEAVEAEEWALRESIKLGSTGTGAAMPSIGEFGEPAAVASTRQVRSDSVADRSDAASTRSAATSRTNNDRQRGGSCEYFPPCPFCVFWVSSARWVDTCLCRASPTGTTDRSSAAAAARGTSPPPNHGRRSLDQGETRSRESALDPHRGRRKWREQQIVTRSGFVDPQLGEVRRL